jgi:hypothetical protein
MKPALIGGFHLHITILSANAIASG